MGSPLMYHVHTVAHAMTNMMTKRSPAHPHQLQEPMQDGPIRLISQLQTNYS
jgi:hypothetical protein